jgi:hypothetical protein
MTIFKSAARILSMFRGAAQSILILVVAAFLCLPFLLSGIVDRGDALTHVAYAHDFSAQFWSGEIYPRWLISANEGYGSPIFLVQYPLPFFITALLRPLTAFPPNATREGHELGVFCFLILVAAAFAARRWFRNSCTSWAATIASLVYISLPFILGKTLGEGSIGQLCTFVWMPFALALCDSIKPRFASVSALGIVLALFLLSQVLTAILFLPLMLVYTVLGCGRSTQTSRIARFASVLLASCIGVGIAAIYVFPLVAYRNLFDVAGLSSTFHGFEFGRSFSYVLSSTLSNRLVLAALVCAFWISVVAAYYILRVGRSRLDRLVMVTTLVLGVALIAPGLGPKLIHLSGFAFTTPVTAVEDAYKYGPAMMLCTLLGTAALGFISYCRISESERTEREQVLLFGACGLVLLMLPWSAPLWKAIPQLANFQFAWRLCAILNVAIAGLFAKAVDSCLRNLPRRDGAPSQGVLIFLALVVIAIGALTWRVDLWFRFPSTPAVDATRNGLVDLMYRSYVPRAQLAEFAKILGTSPDSWDIAPKRVDGGVHAEFTQGRGFVNVDRIGPRKLHVFIQCLEEARVKISQVYVPLWRVAPTGQNSSGPVLRSSADGLLEVALVPGRYDFNLVFDGGPSERFGMILTLVSIVVVLSGLGVVLCRKCLWIGSRTEVMQVELYRDARGS